MKLENGTIVLTGGSSGIGLDILRRLAPENTLINLSRSEPDLGATGVAPPFTHIPVDLGDADSVARAVRDVRTAFPHGIDGLINCAAVQYRPRLLDPDFDRTGVAREIAINLTGPIMLIAGLLPDLVRRQESFILNINSGLGLVPKNESAVYCATKAGLDNFSRGLRAQLQDGPVRMFQAFLPMVDTGMTRGRGVGKLASGDAARLVIQGVERGIPDHDIGKVKALRLLNRISPSVALKIMQGA